MADPWELVLHHDYAGLPGVVFDHSPTRRSHGRVADIDDADFTADGARPGSGSVHFTKPTSAIRVPESASWVGMGFIRIEIVCTTDILHTGGPLITADSFALRANGSGHFSGDFSYTHGGSSEFTSGGAAGYVPDEDWTVVTMMCGLFGTTITVDGVVVREVDGFNGMVADTAGIIIGNDRTGHRGVRGAFDDVKIWRSNPQATNDDFFGRPMDDDTARCWREWQAKLDAALAADPRCAAEFEAAMSQAVHSIFTSISRLPPPTRATLLDLVTQYWFRWRDGQLAMILPILADVIALLRTAGINPEPMFRPVVDNDCAQAILGAAPMHCDPQLTDMLHAVNQTF